MMPIMNQYMRMYLVSFGGRAGRNERRETDRIMSSSPADGCVTWLGFTTSCRRMAVGICYSGHCPVFSIILVAVIQVKYHTELINE